MPIDSKTPGLAPNQFAQVGMGGSQGGGQFESGDGQSGSLQNQQGGTTTTQSVPGVAGSEGDFAEQDGGTRQQEQEGDHSRERRSPGLSDDEPGFNGDREDGLTDEESTGSSRY